MSDKKRITIDRDGLDQLQERLSGFMKELPEDQRGALELLLARAASSEAPDEVVNGYLDLARNKDRGSALPVLARALDRHSNVPMAAGNWFYNIWTHHHK